MTGLDPLFDACIEVQPPLSDEALKSIPAKRGVFALLAEGDQPILVTIAADIRSRLRYRLTAPQPDERRKSADLREITTKVCWQLTHSRFETDWRYLELVRTIFPDTYIDLLPKRRAWFVSIDPSDPTPSFSVVSDLSRPGRHFGPFPDKRSADAFIEGLIDVFDLCRFAGILRQTPAGKACAYKQMGRCAAPCDGSSSLDAYREIVDRAVRFAAGEQEPQIEVLTSQMQAAATAMAFEAAAVVKSRLDRLSQLQSDRYAHVRDAKDFSFVIIQRGPTFHQASTFLCDRGAMVAGPIAEYPPTAEAMDEALTACDALSRQRTGAPDADDGRRMGLVAWYLFSGKPADGLVLHRSALTGAAACELLADAAADMGLRAPARRSAKAEPPATATESE